MALTSTRFYGPATPGASPSTLFTVPAGHRYLIRGVTVLNNNVGATSVLVLYIGGSTIANRVYNDPARPAASVLLLDPWWVLNAGDTFVISGNVANLTVTVCGYDLLI